MWNNFFRSEKPAAKKTSRFLRRDDWSSPAADRGSSPGGFNVHDLADDVLGENIRPARDSYRRLTHPRPGKKAIIVVFYAFTKTCWNDL